MIGLSGKVRVFLYTGTCDMRRQISHWLGHASVETTNRYAAVDLETKRAAIAKACPIGDVDPAVAAWRTDRTILQWLEAL